MSPIIRWTLWERRWPSLFWVLGVVIFISINLAFYPTFRDQQAELEKSFEQIPEAAVALFSDTGDFLSMEGYLSSQVFYLMLPLLLGILAIGMGSSLLAREENSGTIELLLAKPVSRARLLLAKAAAGLLIMLGVGLAASLSVVGLCTLVGMDIELSRLVAATAMSLLLAIVFGALAFTVSAIGGRTRTASVGLAALIAFGGYIVTSLAGTVKWLEWPAKLFPYHYYRPGEILNGATTWGEAAGLTAVILVLGLISVLAFRHRDVGV